MNPNVPDGTLPLLGGEYSREAYASLWEWVQTQTGYLVSESTWAALSNTNNGNVPYYSDGDGSTTFRVPALKCWIKGKDGTETVGTYLDAGLPNITGSATTTYSVIRSNVTGALYGSTADTGTNPTSSPAFPNTVTTGKINFDASHSNSIYGNSTTVQPESIIGMWLVKAYGVVVDNGSIDVRDYIDEKIEEIDKFRIPLGYEYFTFNPHIPQGSLPLFGGEYSRATYADLWAWVQEQTGYCITELEWQDLSTAQNGNVPYYSSGDGSTTFRVPSLKCWVKGANGTVTEVGSYLEAGLPNITGTMAKPSNDGYYPNSGSGAFRSGAKTANYRTQLQSADSGLTDTQTFDASRSSSIYGNSSTVQPESIVGMWLVKAYGTIVDTGQIDEQQYIDDRIATCLPLMGGTMLGNIQWTKGAIGYRGTAHHDPSVINRQLVLSAGTVDSAWNDGNAKLCLHTYDDTETNTAENGGFVLQASDGTNAPFLEGLPNGDLKWNSNNVITSALTGNVLSAYGTSSTMNSDVELCSITNHTAGLWLIIGHVDLNFAMNDGKAYNNVITAQSHGSRNVRSTGYNGGGSINAWLISLNANEKISLKGYCPASSGSGSIRGTLQMVRLA